MTHEPEFDLRVDAVPAVQIRKPKAMRKLLLTRVADDQTSRRSSPQMLDRYQPCGHDSPIRDSPRYNDGAFSTDLQHYESSINSLFRECGNDVSLFIATVMDIVEKSGGIQNGNISLVKPNCIQLEWTENEFAETTRSVGSEEEYLNYSPRIFMDRHSANPCHNYNYQNSNDNELVMPFEPYNQNIPSSRSSVNSYSSLQANLTFVEDVNQPRGSISARSSLSCQTNNERGDPKRKRGKENIQIVATSAFKSPPGLACGSVSKDKSRRTFVMGGGFRATSKDKSAPDDSYSRNYGYYKKYGFGGRGAKTSYAHNFPTGAEPSTSYIYSSGFVT